MIECANLLALAQPGEYGRKASARWDCILAWCRGGTSPARRLTTFSKRRNVAVRVAFCEAAASSLLRVNNRRHCERESAKRRTVERALRDRRGRAQACEPSAANVD